MDEYVIEQLYFNSIQIAVWVKIETDFVASFAKIDEFYKSWKINVLSR
jgi:hypothetical protein